MGSERARHAACVAVIEDDAATREVFIDILLDAGYQVVAWDGREDPLGLIASVSPDLVVQDIRLGFDLSIWELLDELERLPAERRPGVLVCSADTAFLRRHQQELEDRLCAIIEKPFDLNTFLGTVASCLELSAQSHA